MSLFDLMSPEAAEQAKVTPPDIPEWPIDELLSYEKELMGFYVSGHPISKYQKEIETFQANDLCELPELYHNDTVRVGAYISAATPKITRKEGQEDRKWIILNLETQEAQFECLMFSEAYERAIAKNPEIFTPGNVVFIDGEVNNENRKRPKKGMMQPVEQSVETDDSQKENDVPPKIFGREIYTVDEMPERFTTELQVKLYEGQVTTEQLQKLAQICKDNEGETPVIFFVHQKDGKVAILRNASGNGISFYSGILAQFEDAVGADNIFQCVDRHPTQRPQRKFRRFED